VRHLALGFLKLVYRTFPEVAVSQPLSHPTFHQAAHCLIYPRSQPSHHSKPRTHTTPTAPATRPVMPLISVCLGAAPPWDLVLVALTECVITSVQIGSPLVASPDSLECTWCQLCTAKS